LFADTAFYAAAVPSYVGGVMTFAWASDSSVSRELSLATLADRVIASGIKTRYYNPALHLGAFALPQYLVDSLR
jgi:spermidine synthase